MRPLRLDLQAFGPYPGSATVDFEALADVGLFLVSGPTGAGKTSIFDSVCWALYGELPGIREGTGHVRSHHAEPDQRCEVRLEFDAGGDRWRVSRWPKQDRPSKRGDGFTTDPAGAGLERLVDGDWVAEEAGARNVAKRCEAMLGLTADQFQRVVLLPQGRFERVLHAESSERKDLLRSLFGASLFERTEGLLADRARAAHAEVKTLLTQRQVHLGQAADSLESARRLLTGDATAQIDERSEPAAEGGTHESSPDEDEGSEDTHDAVVLRADTEALRVGPLADLGSESTAADTARDHSQQALNEANRVAADLEELAGLRKRARAVADTEDDRAADRAAGLAGRAAEPVVAALGRRFDAENARDEAARAVDDATPAATTALEAVGRTLPPEIIEVTLSPIVTELTTEAAQLKELVGKATDADEDGRRATTARGEVDVLDEQIKAAADERTDVEQARSHAKARHEILTAAGQKSEALSLTANAAADLASRRADLDTLRQGFPQAKAEANDARQEHDELFQAFVDGVGPRLAADLVEGEPCRVCGSREHPSPATAADATEIVGIADVEVASEAMNGARDRLAKKETEIEQLEAGLGDAATRPTSELKTAASEAQTAVSEAEQARADAIVLADQIETHSARLEELAGETNAAEKKREAALTRVEEASAAAEKALKAIRDAIGDDDPLARRTAVVAAGERLDALLDAVRDLAAATKALGDETTTAKRALDASDFDDEAAARAAALDGDDIEQLFEAFNKWDAERKAVDEGLERLAKLELPDEPPDLDGLRVVATREREVATALGERRTATATKIDTVEQALDAVDDLDAEVGDRQAEADRLYAVAQTCRGDNPRRISLEAWVLSAHLRDVVTQANLHLGPMSRNRYNLMVDDDVSDKRKQAGLDLLVHDGDTGRTRPTKSLSGGETFLASLALALGLADVVGAGGDGPATGALFVDEGFGSLDADSLDKAVEVLDGLRGRGALVGLITHVETLKAALPVGIEVRKLPGDRGSELVQNL